MRKRRGGLVWGRGEDGWVWGREDGWSGEEKSMDGFDGSMGLML